MRLIDELGNYLFNKTFYKSSDGAWATKQIPNGQEIVDIYCEARYLDFTRISFFLRESKYALTPTIDTSATMKSFDRSSSTCRRLTYEALETADDSIIKD